MSQPFLDAVRAGDQAAAERMLADDPALAGARDGRGTTAVLLALYHGHPALARSLTARRADLDIFEAGALGALERARDLLDADPALAMPTPRTASTRWAWRPSSGSRRWWICCSRAARRSARSRAMACG